MPDRMIEWIDYAGLLYRDGRFEPLGGRSGVRPRRVHDGGPAARHAVRLELRARDGSVIGRPDLTVEESVECHGLEPACHRIHARFARSDELAEIVLTDDGVVRDRRAIGPVPRLRLSAVPDRLDRRTPLDVTIEYAEPVEDAWMYLAWEWDEGRFLPLAAGPPRRRATVDLATLPGGAACRLHVSYTNGLRTNRVASAPMACAPLEPRVRIVEPRDGQTLTAGVPHALLAAVTDPQRASGSSDVRDADDARDGRDARDARDRRDPDGVRDPDDLHWTLDDRPIGRGRHGITPTMDPGTHRLRVRLGEKGDVIDERELKVVAAGSRRDR